MFPINPPLPPRMRMGAVEAFIVCALVEKSPQTRPHFTAPWGHPCVHFTFFVLIPSYILFFLLLFVDFLPRHRQR